MSPVDGGLIGWDSPSFPSEHEPKGKEVLRFQKTDGRKAGLMSNV